MEATLASIEVKQISMISISFFYIFINILIRTSNALYQIPASSKAINNLWSDGKAILRASLGRYERINKALTMSLPLAILHINRMFRVIKLHDLHYKSQKIDKLLV